MPDSEDNSDGRSTPDAHHPPHLPLEVLHRVLLNLHPVKDKSTLATCMRVCLAFNEAIVPELYTLLEISPENESHPLLCDTPFEGRPDRGIHETTVRNYIREIHVLDHEWDWCQKRSIASGYPLLEVIHVRWSHRAHSASLCCPSLDGATPPTVSYAECSIGKIKIIGTERLGFIVSMASVDFGRGWPWMSVDKPRLFVVCRPGAEFVDWWLPKRLAARVPIGIPGPLTIINYPGLSTASIANWVRKNSGNDYEGGLRPIWGWEKFEALFENISMHEFIRDRDWRGISTEEQATAWADIGKEDVVEEGERASGGCGTVG